MANLLQGMGAAQPVSQFIDTALKYQTTQSQMESQRMQQQIFQAKIAQDEKDNKEYDPEAVVAMHPKHIQGPMLKLYQRSGIIDPISGLVKGIDVRSASKLIKEHPEIALEINQADYNNLIAENTKLATKGDEESKAKMLANATEAGNLKRFIDKALRGDTTLVPKGTKGTMSGGVYTPLPGGTEDIQNVDLGTTLGTSESGAEVYHTTMGNVAVDPDTGERRPYSIQSDGNYSKHEDAMSSKNVTLDLPDPAGKKYPGGTMWDRTSEGTMTYIGPAKDPTASARVNIQMGSLGEKGLATMVDNYMVDGKVPSFGFSPAGAAQRRQFYEEVAKRREDTGDTAGAQAARTYGLQADSASLKNARKIYDMMDSYVRNMDAQVNRMETILKDVTRLDARLANVPIRKWAMTVAGSAAESKVSMYTTEISNEIGKLSTGSAASVQELSQSAQQKWDKIHDPNLSVKDLMSLLKETKHAGMLRMTTAKEVIDGISGRIGGGGGGSGSKDPLGLGL